MNVSSPVFESTPSKKFEGGRKRFRAFPNRAVLVVDGEGNIRQITPAARRLLEYGNAEPVPPCFFSHVHGRNMYQVMRDVADMVCYGKPKANWLIRLRTGRGRWQWYRATVTNGLNEDSAIHIQLDDL